MRNMSRHPSPAPLFRWCRTLATCLAIGLGTPALAGSSDADVLPALDNPQPIDSVSIAGLWNFKMTQPSVTGRCPAGFPTSGQVRITVYGSTEPGTPTSDLAPQTPVEEPVQVDILSGGSCSPASMCHLAGGYDGDMLVVSSSAVVDNEGGKATTSWSLQFASDKIGAGVSLSSYVHPAGLECNWLAELSLTRPKENGETGDGGANSENGAGN